MLHKATLDDCALLCELDRILLADAAEGRPEPEIAERAVAAGWDPRGVKIRLNILRELHFLVDRGD
ncbi:MAG TPA: hypothetical protein VG323_06035 [Thermoanaerobaculia bacterium]|nr:hypothetical protein [Thermoanaerobaculia bacterium]